jgi:hypothetical protein
MLTFLIEAPPSVGYSTSGSFDDGNPEVMADILNRRGIRYSFVKYIPFDGGIRFVKPGPRWHKLCKEYVEHDFEIGVTDNVLFYGTLKAMRYLQQRYYPSGWCDFPKLTCQHYYTHYGRYLISQDYTMMPSAEVLRRADELYDRYGVGGHVFIRPDANDKPFPGELVDRDKIEEWHESSNSYQQDVHKLCVVASPVKILQEWRLVVFNGKVVTGSQYRKFIDGRNSVEWEEGYPDDAAAYAEMIVRESNWQPHGLFAMDIGLTDSGLGLIEIGSVNTCGLYCSDIEKVVDAMIAACKM